MIAIWFPPSRLAIRVPETTPMREAAVPMLPEPVKFQPRKSTVRVENVPWIPIENPG